MEGKERELIASIPYVKPLRERLGFGDRSSDQYTRFVKTLNEFRDIYRTARGVSGLEFWDWKRAEHRDEFSRMSTAFINIHGTHFWPDEPSELSTSHLKLGPDRLEIGDLLKKLIFRLNNQKHQNFKNRNKESDKSKGSVAPILNSLSSAESGIRAPYATPAPNATPPYYSLNHQQLAWDPSWKSQSPAMPHAPVAFMGPVVEENDQSQGTNILRMSLDSSRAGSMQPQYWNRLTDLPRESVEQTVVPEERSRQPSKEPWNPYEPSAATIETVAHAGPSRARKRRDDGSDDIIFEQPHKKRKEHAAKTAGKRPPGLSTIAVPTPDDANTMAASVFNVPGISRTSSETPDSDMNAFQEQMVSSIFRAPSASQGTVDSSEHDSIPQSVLPQGLRSEQQEIEEDPTYTDNQSMDESITHIRRTYPKRASGTRTAPTSDGNPSASLKKTSMKRPSTGAAYHTRSAGKRVARAADRGEREAAHPDDASMQEKPESVGNGPEARNDGAQQNNDNAAGPSTQHGAAEGSSTTDAPPPRLPPGGPRPATALGLRTLPRTLLDYTGGQLRSSDNETRLNTQPVQSRESGRNNQQLPQPTSLNGINVVDITTEDEARPPENTRVTESYVENVHGTEDRHVAQGNGTTSDAIAEPSITETAIGAPITVRIRCFVTESWKPGGRHKKAWEPAGKLSKKTLGEMLNETGIPETSLKTIKFVFTTFSGGRNDGVTLTVGKNDEDSFRDLLHLIRDEINEAKASLEGMDETTEKILKFKLLIEPVYSHKDQERKQKSASMIDEDF